MSEVVLVLAGIAIKTLFDSVVKGTGFTFTMSVGKRDKD